MDHKAAFQALLVTSSLQYKAGIPALALAQGGGKRALVYGELDDKTLHALAREEVTITTSATAAHALRTLAWSTFDAVLVVPEVPDGLDLAKALKLGAISQDLSNLDPRLAAVRHRLKPVFVVPFKDDVEYAVIVAAPGLAYLERTDRYPLARAVARFNASRLFASRGGDDGAGVA